MLGESAIPDHFREQAEWCRALGSPFMDALCRAFADDYEAGGIVAGLVSDWPTNPRKDALALRLAGCLHHATLTGRAPALAAAYPARQPDWSMQAVWPLARTWLAENEDWVRAFLESAPQTNETRRCIALLPGFLELAHRFDMPMHLMELGASAGLNQNWDRYAYETGSWHWPADEARGVTISTDWQTSAPRHLDAQPQIASRAACDLSPFDLSDPDQVMRLKCYTWPDQNERLSRLDAAVKLAQETGISVDKANAANWLEQKLMHRPAKGLTIVYHSVFLIYPPREVIGQIMSMIASYGMRASEAAPLAWLSYESEALFGGNRESPRMEARLQVWPGGEARTLNCSDGHVTRVVAPPL
ncbi:MAG: hypothetical protein CME84_05060 [Henriciella sp.]|uniref:DUF2332 domain-containing protein n=1 Tax=Henriciella sp. TaxID=1968823 RepID=UPI000C0EDB05|nr:DUF2332 domain-containing protein [Henriciella sp.]MAN73442.1 hypothetical protein [Henriciella sp.]MBF33609.1 hypothetical protein [Hyphomonadaceae bacterium]PHR77487.1 MAG: hypothetical protein COA64_09085 [Henriciella sp.]